METINTKYIKITENNRDNNNYLQVEFYYTLGGYQYSTYTVKPRGYYISVTPIEKSERNGVNMISFTGFTGFYEMLEKCDRKSKKAQQAASEKMPAYEKMMIDFICKKYGYIVEV